MQHLGYKSKSGFLILTKHIIESKAVELIHCTGPGTYNTSGAGETLGQTGPAFTIPIKGPMQNKNNGKFPGPGEYEPPPTNAGAAYSIGAKLESGAKSNETPGPGIFVNGAYWPFYKFPS